MMMWPKNSMRGAEMRRAMAGSASRVVNTPAVSDAITMPITVADNPACEPWMGTNRVKVSHAMENSSPMA